METTVVVLVLVLVVAGDSDSDSALRLQPVRGESEAPSRVGDARCSVLLFPDTLLGRPSFSRPQNERYGPRYIVVPAFMGIWLLGRIRVGGGTLSNRSFGRKSPWVGGSARVAAGKLLAQDLDLVTRCTSPISRA